MTACEFCEREHCDTDCSFHDTHGILDGRGETCAPAPKRRTAAEFRREGALAAEADRDAMRHELEAAHRSWQADVARLTGERDTLASRLVEMERERDALQRHLNEECVRRAVDVENLRAELGAALLARVDDLKAVTTGLAESQQKGESDAE
jgi:hypothetical protein